VWQCNGKARLGKSKGGEAAVWLSKAKQRRSIDERRQCIDLQRLRLVGNAVARQGKTRQRLGNAMQSKGFVQLGVAVAKFCLETQWPGFVEQSKGSAWWYKAKA